MLRVKRSLMPLPVLELVTPLGPESLVSLSHNIAHLHVSQWVEQEFLQIRRLIPFLIPNRDRIQQEFYQNSNFVPYRPRMIKETAEQDGPYSRGGVSSMP
ncbi:hypothetical protein Trydic_g8097 [Trypoxylus dichotomus]